jgi:hypothetical protein
VTIKMSWVFRPHSDNVNASEQPNAARPIATRNEPNNAIGWPPARLAPLSLAHADAARVQVVVDS